MKDKALSYIESSIKINKFKLSSWRLKYNIAVALDDKEVMNQSISNIKYLSQWIN